MTTRQTASTGRRPRDRKRQIVLSARDLFVERGFPNVSMALIADSVGITAGALYRHFGNKNELFEAVFEESFSYLTQPVEREAAEDFDAFIDEVLAKLIEHPYTADLWAREVRYLRIEAQEQLRANMRHWAQAFLPPLRLRRPGLDPGQEELLTWALQTALASLGSSSVRAPREARLTAVREAMSIISQVQISPTGPKTSRPAAARLPQSRRERLLQAAIEQFAERGYQETSMASIGTAADVTGPNLYGYFENKADLLRAVFERGQHAAWLTLDRALNEPCTAEQALARLVAGQLRLSHVWTRWRTEPMVELELVEGARAAQREYVDEWVALLREVDPELRPGQARLRVGIAAAILSDLARTPHVSSRESFPRNVEAIALAVVLNRV